MNGYTAKKKGRRGFFITLGALMTLGAVSIFKKGKNIVSKIGDKIKSIGN